jgi:alkylation response protein AidB-like acyl-CoA dehydrogenase
MDVSGYSGGLARAYQAWNGAVKATLAQAGAHDDERGTTMELQYTADERRFQDEVRAFIAANLPADLSERTLAGESVGKEGVLRWHGMLARRGWGAPAWPAEYGGTGWSVTQRYIFEQESARAGCPNLPGFGLNLVGPVIYTYGNPAQKAHWLARIINGQDYWCQGYSEPGAGSDLAALRTKAVPEGDHFVVNGQKTWTSVAHEANMMFCLVRTNSAGKKQEGISFLLIDMTSPGITVRPIITIDNERHVNDTFLDNVRVPRANLIGEIDKGWTYAKYLLQHERANEADFTNNQRRFQQVRRLAEQTMQCGRPLIEDPDFAGRLADAEVELTALEYTALRVLANEAAGRGSGDAASLLKVKGTELNQRLNDLACEAVGYGALPFERLPGPGNEPLLSDAVGPGLTKGMLFSRAKSIWGGSNEIQHNVIAKHVLGL